MDGIERLADSNPSRDYIALGINVDSTCLGESPRVRQELFLRCANYDNVILNFGEGYRFDTSATAVIVAFAKQYPPVFMWLCGNTREIAANFEIAKVRKTFQNRGNVIFYEDRWENLRVPEIRAQAFDTRVPSDVSSTI